MPNARVWLIVAIGFVLLGAGLLSWQWYRTPLPPAAVTGTTTSYGVAQVGGPFELVDHHGQTRRDADFRGRYLLVYFGYTFCPDVCPTTLLAMSQALRSLAESDPDLAERVAPLFITVDPERDTVEALAAYVPNFHPDLVALTGSAEQIAAAAKEYRVYYAKVEDDSASDYLMDHSSFIYLMGPDGAYVTHFDHFAQAAKIVDGLRRYLES